MKRVLITGASGFTGHHLIQALKDEFDVHGLVHTGGAALNRDVPVTSSDLLDPDGLANSIQSVRPDAIIHLAAVSFVAHDNIREIYDVNVVGSRNLLAAARRSGCGLVILASSANVYGKASGLVSEATAPAPVNDYAVSKLSMEHLVGCFPDLNCIITRPFNYTGRFQSQNFVIPKIIDHARRKAPVIRLGNLDVERDYSDVRMIAEAYKKILLSKSVNGGIYNLCSGIGRSLLEVIDIVSHICRHKMQIEVDPAFVRPNEVPRLVGDASRFEQEMGRISPIAFEDTLRWMLEM